jgi:antitoxin component of MazEF toxin-antitoxin module
MIYESVSSEIRIDNIMILTYYNIKEAKNMDLMRSSTVNNWGTSLGIRLPADFVKAIRLKPNSPVNISLEDEKIIITKIKKRRTISEIFEDNPCGFIKEREIDWGEPVGDEVW